MPSMKQASRHTASPEPTERENRYKLGFSVFTALAMLVSCFLVNDGSPILDLKKERNEYVFIAESIALGLGFSNAFGNCTMEQHKLLCAEQTPLPSAADIVVTPTAWMPPAYPYILATIFKIFGIRSTASLFVILALKLIGLAYLMYWLQDLLFGSQKAIFDRIVLVALYLGMIVLNQDGILKQVHDVWVIAPLVVIACGYIIKSYKTTFTKSDRIHLIILGAFAPLATATVGYALFVLAIVSYFFARRENRKYIGYLILSIVCSLMLWCVRNYVVLGKPILNKSNLWYDFYQAQVLDDDGIVSYSTFQVFHPIVALDAHLDYLQNGEIAFLAKYKEKSLLYLKSNLEDYCIRSIRRLLNSLVVTPTLDTFDVVSDVPNEALDKLVEMGLATYHPYANTYRWVNIQYDIKPRSDLFYTLFPKDIAIKLEHSLKYSKASYFYHRNKARAVWQRRLMSTLPSICLLIGLLWGRIRRTIEFKVAVSMYAFYLIPYVLVSHYQRYQLGLLGLQCMIILFVYLALRDKYGKTHYL